MDTGIFLVVAAVVVFRYGDPGSDTVAGVCGRDALSGRRCAAAGVWISLF